MKPSPLKRRHHFLVLLSLLLSVIAPVYAGIDAMQLRLLEPYWQDLRWDNIESSPAWLNGVKPYYHEHWRMHRVLLAPLQQTTIRLPAYESFRLYQPEKMLGGDELEVYASNGSGLAAKQILQRSTDGHSLVLSPNSATPLLIHVTRGRFQVKDFEAALFVSRRVPINAIAPYRNLVWSSARWCLLGQEPFALPELYNALPALQKYSIEVVGPVRLLLKNRLDYEQHASALIQDYRIHSWLDDAKFQTLNFSTSVETSRVITVNAALNVVGREEQGYLEIPHGRHRLVLQADRALYIQVLAQTEHDYLFNSLNNPRLPVEAIRQIDLLPLTELMLQAQTANRVAEDNSRQAGAMAAVNRLRDTALQRKDYPEGLSEAEQLRGFRTFYRDLMPSKKIASAAQFMAYFLAEPLAAVNRPQSNAILADQHLAEALQRVSHAYFTPLTDVGRIAANEYTLPDQQTDGQLRLIVDQRQCVQRLLRVEINQYAAQDVWLRCDPEQAHEVFARGLAGTALIRLQQEPNSHNVSLDALFSEHLPPAPLIASAVYELPLPKSARTVKIWQASERKTTPVNIAVQYRASKPFLLSEHSYLARLRDSSGHRLLTQFMANMANETGKTSLTVNSTELHPVPPLRHAQGERSEQALATPPPAEQPLHNEWLPLQRLLQSQSRLYQAAVNRQPPAQATLAIAESGLANERALATQAEQQQNWLDALEHWGKVVNYSAGVARQHAQLAQANALSHLGENYLAESLRKYLSLTADADVAEAAIHQLTGDYQAQQDNAALQTLAAAMLIQRPSAAHRRLLLDALLKNGEYRFVLLLGLSFGEQPPLDSLLTAAYQLQWWETYHGLQEKLPAEQRAFWHGLKAQQHGDYAAALEAWSPAPLKPWHDYLQQGLQLRDSLMTVTAQNAPALYQQWQHWQQQYPGVQVWQNAPWHVTDYAGSVSYYALERDVYAQAFTATAQRPVVLNLLGPITLNLQIRPLHPVAPLDSALNGWLDIADNNEAFLYPFTNNVPAQGLQLSGADKVQAGNEVNLVYQVGQGQHELRLSSEQAALAINIQAQRPELALSVLPVLQADTFAEMGFISRSHNTAHNVNKAVLK